MPRSNLNFSRKLTRLSTSLTNTGTISSGSALETSVSSVAGSGVTVYNTIDDLPLSGNTAGDQAFIDSDNLLYIFSGEGWYKIGLINTSPSITSGGAGTYTLATDGTPTVITLIASDPEGIPITWSYATTGLDSEATITQGTGDSANIFTITPSTNTAKGGEFSVTFTASDGVNIATDVNSFTLTFRDSYISNVSSLLQADVSTYIDDASSNQFVLTETGDVRPSSFSPYKGSYYSNYFDGNGDYLGTPNITMLAADQTVEFWAWHEGTDADGVLGSISDNSFTIALDNGKPYIWVNYQTLTNISGYTISDGYTATGNAAVSNGWHHYAYDINVGASTTTLIIYVDGAVYGSLSWANTSLTARGVGRGLASPYERYFVGYISNLRVVNSRVYTGNFTPPSGPLTTTGGTYPSTTNVNTSITASEVSLLTCQSNRFIDNSTNGHTITANGNTAVSGFVPFESTSGSTGSAVFTSSNYNYLLGTNSSNLEIGANEFTLEAWVFPTSYSSSGGAIISKWYNTSYRSYRMDIGSSGQLVLLYNSSGGALGGTVPLNQWSHVAITRDSSNLVRFFINGQVVTSQTISDSIGQGATSLVLGVNHEAVRLNLSTGHSFVGNISDVRIVIGSALYTSNFTPSTSSLTTTSQGATASEVELLTLQTNNPINNKTFLDKSGHTHVITPFGDAHQGSFTPYSPFGYSVYFDGTGDYLTSTSSALGSENFTIECWIYPIDRPATDYNFIFDTRSAGNNNGFSLWMVQSSGYLGLFDGPANVFVNSTTVVPLNQWSHVALVRNGSDLRAYLNGVSVASRTTSSHAASTSLYVGTARDNPGNSRNFAGYISNFRIIKGTALYTAAFTPSTTALTPTNETVLLTCQSPSFIDNSKNRFALTRSGDVKVTSYSPFTGHTITPNGHGVYFDGSGDYLTIPQDTSLELSGDFTIEGWVYVPPYTSVGSGYIPFFAAKSSSTADRFGLAWGDSGFSYDLLLLGPTDTQFYRANVQRPSYEDQWMHFALVRISNVNKVYINGTAVTLGGNASVTNSSTVGASDWHIGYSSGLGGAYFPGYISNFRVIKGTGLYTSDFTPSTTPLTTTSQSATASEVSLLTCQSSTVVDNSLNSHTITVVGNTQPAEFNPFGFTATERVPYDPSVHGGSGYFDGTGDYLTAAGNPIYEIGSGDWTCEFWVWATSFSATQIFTSYEAATGTAYGIFSWAVYCDAGKFGIDTSTGSASNFGLLSVSNIPTNTWTHLAVTRSGNTARLFIDGILDQSSTSFTGTPFVPSNSSLFVGGAIRGYPFNGYISGLRIVKGTALYTSSFVPPKRVTSVVGEVLSLPFNDAAIYDATTRANYNTIGNAKASNAVKKYGSGSMYFDGTGDCLAMNANVPELLLGTSPFTIEFWFNTTSSTQYAQFIGNEYINGFTITINSNSSTSGDIVVYNGTTGLINSATSVSYRDGNWYHLAFVRDSNGSRLYLDGTQQGSTNAGQAAANFDGGTLRVGIGANLKSAGRDYLGYIDDLRITKGVARYTSNFTAPTRVFQAK